MVAAGPFSGAVSGMAGVELPLEAVIRHKVVVPDLPAVPQCAPMTIDDDTGAHWRPALAGAFLLHTDPSTPPGPPLETSTRCRLRIPALDPASPVSLAKVAPFWAEAWAMVRCRGWCSPAVRHDTDHRPLLGETRCRRAVDQLRVQRPRHHGRTSRQPSPDRHRHRCVIDDNPFRSRSGVRSTTDHVL